MREISDPRNNDDNVVSIHAFITTTYSSSPAERAKAVRNLCPCHVKANVDDVWDRIIEMAEDKDVTVRRAVLHTLCDGSPKAREHDIIEALRLLSRDHDKEIRRKVHKALAHYDRDGRW
eukprot:CAMPEP_0113883874 /NCGR_PEP_ID=MMETSP0780_2-20120614/9873_1 /TAXON_ID=652834 /ORGANISM="Palpitomonas bilix" /LENGTH=118 /DNA_ID=CAMNT_0000871289 /DNA_START=15 /DNA_END=368 /DNA_ORIENTATION=+ /assembly_acc=CAM_ASM_000599